MRRFRHIVLLLFSLTVIASCDSWLELIPPDGLVLDEYWKSKEDLEATLMGAYQRFASMDERLFLYGELRADLLMNDQNTSLNHRLIMEGNIYPDNEMCDWTDFYVVINYCNNVLKYAPVIQKKDQTFTEYQMKGYEAEAIFLRSLAYFYLVRIFKEVPLMMEASEKDDVDFFLPKSTEEEILNTVYNDLQEAVLFVRDDYGTKQDNLGRATRGAFLALLADISLWRFEYENCIDYVNELEKLGYTLLPAGKWFTLFNPGNTLEGIFEFQFDQTQDQTNSMWEYTHFQFKRFVASDHTIDILSPESSYEYIRGPGTFRSHDAMIWKYCGAAADGKSLRPGSESNSANWIVYRYSDVLLMKAEALSQLGQYEEALSILNQIRTRALMNPLEVTFSAEAFEDAIMDERALEFAFEGKRWFDLLRLGRRNDYKRKSKLIEIIIDKVPSTQKLVLASKLTNPYGWYLPIEEEEMERNEALVQNPYYADYVSD